MKQSPIPTLEDVARVADVSTATISRCINSPQKVAKATRQRIEKIIDELGYTPDFGGRTLASGRSNTIGAVIPTMANAMFASGLQAFAEVLEESGVTLLVASSGYDGYDELKQIRSLVSRGADGLLLIGATRPDATANFLEKRSIPYVNSWCFEADSTRVFAGFDNFSAAKQIAMEVLDSGHRKIAMIAGLCHGNDRAQARLDGVQAAIDEYGDNAKLHSIQESHYSLEQGGEAFEIIVKSTSVTAVICGNDVLAAGAIVRARALQVRVPQDISITGFDDIILATAVHPALTTVRVPQMEMGRAAASLLLEMISKKATQNGQSQKSSPPDSIELKTAIIRRDSLAAPRTE